MFIIHHKFCFVNPRVSHILYNRNIGLLLDVQYNKAYVRSNTFEKIRRKKKVSFRAR